MRTCGAIALALLPLAGCADARDAHPDDEATREAFVEANILSIFYHELGHAVIDLLDVPILGQEEDAADVMSTLLIDEIFEEETAQDIAIHSAFGLLDEPESVEEIAWWDLHGPNEQRYYNHVCLFYGADPGRREGLARDLGLPPERAESCPEEFEQASASWGAIFDELYVEDAAGDSLILATDDDAPTTLLEHVLADEIAELNAELALPRAVVVTVASCGEPNAFYDPEAASITFCTEFVPHLDALFRPR